MNQIFKSSKIEENALQLSKQMGYDFTAFPLTDNLIHYLRISTFLIKHFHVLDVGLGNTGKSYCATNISNKFTTADKFTVPAAFGSSNIGEGYFNTDNDVVFIDEIGNLINSSLCNDFRSSIKSYANGDSIIRDGFSTNITCPSMYLAGNLSDKEQSKLEESPEIFSFSSLESIPSFFLEEPMRERFILIPSFLSSKLHSYHYYAGEKQYSKEDFSSLFSSSRCDYDSSLQVPFTTHTREVKKAQKIISALIKLIYPCNYNQEQVEELYEFSEFIVNLSNYKYNGFWKTDNGKKFVIRLCLNYLPENSILEECYFLKNRVLVKIKDEDLFYKIGLNKYGIIENKREFEFYNKNKTNDILAKICDISESGVVVKQEYAALISNPLRFENLDFLYSSRSSELRIATLEKKIDILTEENHAMKSSIRELNDYTTEVLKFVIRINNNVSNNIIPEFIKTTSAINQENILENFKKEIKTSLNLTIIPTDSIGFSSIKNEYKLVNYIL